MTSRDRDDLQIAIRLANRNDIPTVLAIAAQTPTASHWTPEQYFQVAAQGILAVAESPTSLCGFIAAQTLTDVWEIQNVVVVPEFRRKRVAEKLVRDLMQSARDKHAARILLEVRESNLAARALYEKLGFTVDGTRNGYYKNPREGAIMYSASL